MRVLLVADIVGGVRTFVAELAAALARCGVEVDLAVIGPPDRVRDLADLPTRSLAVRDLRLEWMEEPWEDVEACAEWVQELAERHHPDVVHMNTFTPVRDPALPVLLTVHSCVLTWWRAVHGTDAPASWSRYRDLARAALRRAEVVIAPTRALLDDLSRVYGPLPRPRVIPNGRAAWGSPGGERGRLVVSAGRLWDAAKNVSTVAAAAPAIDGEVLVIGPGDVPGVRALGPVATEDVLGWFRRAAVFAEPARYEPFGIAALEAAQSGCALVLGDIPTLREVWGEAAAFVAPDDPAELAACVNGLLSDESRRARLAAAARSRAERYTPEAMAAGYLDGYRRSLRAPAAV